MSSTRNNPSREHWHSLFSAALNGTMTNVEHDQLSELLRESREARQLWFVYNDNEIGLCELYPLAGPPTWNSSTPTRSRRSPLAICLGVGTVAALVIAVIWISNPGTPGTNHEVARQTSTDSELSARPYSVLSERQSDREAQITLRESELIVLSQTRTLPVVPNHHKEWRNISAGVAHADMLYVVDSGHLYEVSPIDGSRRIVGDDDWQNTAAMGAASGHLYIVSDNQLYEVNPKTGVRRSLGKPQWAETEAIVTVGDKLYIVGNGLLHRVNPNDGSHEVLHNKHDSTNDPRKPKH